NHLSDWVVGRLAGRPAALRCVGDESVEHRLQRSNRRTRHAAKKDLTEGNPVQRRAIDGLTRTHALEIVHHPAGALFRHEHVIKQDIIAAGRTKARHTPGIDDPIVGTWNHEQSDVWRAGGATLHGTAEQRPLREVTTAGEAPMAAEPKS